MKGEIKCQKNKKVTNSVNFEQKSVACFCNLVLVCGYCKYEVTSSCSSIKFQLLCESIPFFLPL